MENEAELRERAFRSGSLGARRKVGDPGRAGGPRSETSVAAGTCRPRHSPSFGWSATPDSELRTPDSLKAGLHPLKAGLAQKTRQTSRKSSHVTSLSMRD